MPSFSNNTFASYFKRIFQISQTTNTGVDAIARNIQTGDGSATSASISDDVFAVQPVNDDTTNTFYVKKQNGNNVLDVDTTNSLVKVGAGQVNATTQYQTFSATSADFSLVALGRHVPIQIVGGTIQGIATLGTGTNPDTSYTISSTADDIVNSIWYIPDAITIDAIYVWIGADEATGDTLRMHLMSYDVDTSNGSTGGDLSNGVVVADGADITSAGNEQAYYQSMTIQSADVASGKILLLTYLCDSVNSDYSINARVKYHIQ